MREATFVVGQDGCADPHGEHCVHEHNSDLTVQTTTFPRGERRATGNDRKASGEDVKL
jgi:hypothetical protein